MAEIKLRLGGIHHRLAGGGTNSGLTILLISLLIIFSLTVGDRFLSTDTFLSMAVQMPEFGILSIAMMITLISGGLNLSLIATANLSALSMAYLMTQFTGDTGGIAWGMWQVVAVAIGLAIATLVGLINGVLIAYFRVSPILATLGTMTAVKGLAVGLSRGNSLSGFPEPIVYIGNGTLLGLPFSLFVFVVCALAIAFILKRTVFGNALYMIGSNEAATMFSGIDTKRVIVKLYMLSNFLAGVAALIMMSRFNSANASYGESYLLITIVAAVLGGTDPMGGTGRITGLILALIILQVISSAFNLLGLSQFLTIALWGAVLLATSIVGPIFNRTRHLLNR